MSTQRDKNVAVSEMLGAVQEQWYPPNKDTQSSGLYLAFPTSMFEYVDDNGNKQQYKWYPNNTRYHNDKALKFDTDANWQNEVLQFLLNKNCSYSEVLSRDNVSVTLKPNDGTDFMVQVSNKTGNAKDARFEAFFQISEYYKKLEDARNKSVSDV
jgi:hypothetical protein